MEYERKDVLLIVAAAVAVIFITVAAEYTVSPSWSIVRRKVFNSTRAYYAVGRTFDTNGDCA
jgi:hypothetical protein